MNGHSGPKVIVLYQISNVKGEGQSYNAFELPGTNGGISLGAVKENCHALRHLSPSGADGYHWRVRVDDKGNKGAAPKYSWWDIQDEAARLPVQHVGFSELQNMLSVSKSSSSSSSDSGHHSSKNMVRSLGKAMNKVAATVEGATSSTTTFDNGPKVPILMFKLLDICKLHDEHNTTRALPSSSSTYASSYVNRAPSARQQDQRQHAAATTAASKRPPPPNPPASSHNMRQPTAPAQPQQRSATSSRPSSNTRQPQVAEGTLMDFGPGPATHSSHHTTTATPVQPAAPRPPSNETRAQKLKREYEQKQNTENRVWDEVDQRWVAVDSSNGETISRGSTSAPPGVVSNGDSSISNNATNLKGISLDSVNTAGKSAHVAAAVQTRVNEMKESQAKAVAQIREREQAKKMNEAEEDLVRQQLEPKIKAWSEEHGKKKQLRALLANLHTILWPDANWKQVNLGDLLDDKKCKLAFHKASRVVHPDKTIHLSAEQRFLAKRIFDALSQAKTEFDNQK